MKSIIKSYVIFLLLITSTFNYGQISNVKLDDNVYSFLSHLSQKGIIHYEDLVKPLSRRYIAEKLIETRNNFTLLTSLQKDELEFYEEEFGYEIMKQKSGVRSQKSEEMLKGKSEEEGSEELGEKENDEEQKTNNSEQITNNKEEITNENDQITNDEKKQRDLLDKSWEFEIRTNDVVNNDLNEKEQLAFFEKDNYNRLRFFSYENSKMRLNVSPLIGYENGNWEKEKYNNLFAGVKFNGEFGGVLGFNFELKQTRQTPSYIHPLYNNFSNKTSIDLLFSDSERLEYPAVNVDLGLRWNWGSFTIGKNNLNWGYGERGKIVLSDKAPSFPYLRLDLKPADWFSFNYIHGWLNTDVIDSNSYYSTWRYNDYGNTDRFGYISKFIALHSFTFYPIKGLEFSLGESVVYADKIQVLYLIPIMFFDLADEYLMRNSNYAGSSTQLFLSLSSRNHIPNTHLYSNFHADELTPDGLFDPKSQYYKMAFTFGGNVIDLPINNLGLTLEYTKIYPGEYRHFIPTLTYESSSSLMGHWIGDNADMFYWALDYSFFRGFKLKLWAQYIRKGTEALGNRAYKVTIPQPHFLFTDNIRDRKNYSYFGIDTEYEIIPELWVKAHFQYIEFEQKVDIGKYNTTLFRDFSITLGYGI
ncbi:MAG: hypothetical protein IPH62_17590 [Ignavibacteriae bacterium]|nr:hypothetical protein [Ignavibacteriota bacterium]